MSDRQNVTLVGEGRHFALLQTDTVRGAGVFNSAGKTAHACMTHETQKRPQLSFLRFEV